jgi:hypothetical protein
MAIGVGIGFAFPAGVKSFNTTVVAARTPVQLLRLRKAKTFSWSTNNLRAEAIRMLASRQGQRSH